jgi:hypothetical protein
MKSRIVLIVGLLLVFLAIFVFHGNEKEGDYDDWPMMDWGHRGYGGGMMGGIYDTSFVSEMDKEDLSEDEKGALVVAINEEYKAKALYENMVRHLGEFMPADMIIIAEGSHIELLRELFEKYDLEIPVDEWVFSEGYDSYSAACLGGEKAEVENIKSYDKSFPKVDNKDIYEAFSLLRWGSSMHLRAFQMCSEQGYGMMGGSGMGGFFEK